MCAKLRDLEMEDDLLRAIAIDLEYIAIDLEYIDERCCSSRVAYHGGYSCVILCNSETY